MFYVLGGIYRKNQNIFSPLMFFFGNRAVGKIIWENMVQPDRPQMAA
jgi:hypothetical protein